MKIAGFEFSEGARFQPGASHNANEVGEHLERLRAQCKGELTPQDVLNDAKHNNSPLHSFFEWNDGDAAEKYRLQQARGLIRAVVAIYTSPDKPAVRQKAYVHIAEPGAPHYRETGHAMSQKGTRDLVLKQAWQEFQSWRKRYETLKEFSDLFEVADKVADKLIKLEKI
jgi:1,4-alpha-glucan branching enzyme